MREPLLLAGVFAPPVLLIATVLASLARPGYDQVEQLMSELGEPGSSTALFYSAVGFGLSGGLLVTFALAVRRATGAWRPAAGLLLLGVSLVLLGVFPCDPGCPVPPTTFAGVLHFPVLTLTGYAGLFLAPLLVAPWLRTRAGLEGLASPSLVVAGVTLGLIVATFAGSAAASDRMVGFGLLQRLFVALSMGWIGVIAFGVVREGRAADPAATEAVKPGTTHA